MTVAARARPRARAAEPTARLSPERWIEAATEVLVDQGIDHVRVDVLAGQLGVTRGSFYWHFRDREDLLRRVLSAWRERATEQLTRRLERAHTDPRQQVHDVISLPFRGRAAAQAARIAYHVHLFASLGFELAEARSRAFVLYGYEVAESLLHRQGSDEQKRARALLIEQLVLQPVRSDGR